MLFMRYDTGGDDNDAGDDDDDDDDDHNDGDHDAADAHDVAWGYEIVRDRMMNDHIFHRNERKHFQGAPSPGA